jgi:phosphoribosyl 1,2-cyclic phosphodiesterase
MVLRTGDCVDIGDLRVETFTKCHDAVDPMGVVLSCDGARLGIATDFGRSTRLLEERLGRCGALVLEFNHDVDLLAKGPYPLELQRRIRGQDGHLSNEQGAMLLSTIAHEALRFVVLAHLSQVNNDPRRAYETAFQALKADGRGMPTILVTRQDEVIPPIDL